jgi:hypothetical protein
MWNLAECICPISVKDRFYILNYFSFVFQAANAFCIEILSVLLARDNDNKICTLSIDSLKEHGRTDAAKLDKYALISPTRFTDHFSNV